MNCNCTMAQWQPCWHMWINIGIGIANFSNLVWIMPRSGGKPFGEMNDESMSWMDSFFHGNLRILNQPGDNLSRQNTSTTICSPNLGLYQKKNVNFHVISLVWWPAEYEHRLKLRGIHRHQNFELCFNRELSYISNRNLFIGNNHLYAHRLTHTFWMTHVGE